MSIYNPITVLFNQINTTIVKGMAFAEPNQRIPQTFGKPMLDNGLITILRAGRIETAAIWQQGGYQSLIYLDQTEHYIFHSKPENLSLSSFCISVKRARALY
jgi:hypothetical protein